MDISGSYDIPAPRATVWAAINDPEVLKACIPGCDEMTADGDNGFSARVTAKIGPVKATFSGAVRLEDVQAPASYTITGEGKGGAAGFAKGQAKVHLEELDAATTRLTYSVDAQVGGKLAQVGSRLIQGAAKKYADDFFSTLVTRLSNATPAAEAPETSSPAAATAPTPADPHSPAPHSHTPATGGGSHWTVYAAGLLVIAAAAYLLLR